MSEPSPSPPPPEIRRGHLQGALRCIAASLAGPHAPEDLLGVVIEEALRLLDAEAGRIRVLGEGGILTTAAFRGPEALEDLLAEGEFEREIHEAVIERCEIWHRPVTIDPSRPASQVAVPLSVEGHAIGVLELWRTEGPDFSTVNENLLEMLSNFATAMLCGTALYADLETHNRQLEMLHEVQFLITAHRDLQEVLDTIARTTRESFDARECTIRLLEEGEAGQKNLRVAAWVGRPIWATRVWPLVEGTVDGEVMAGRVVAIEDLIADRRTRDSATIRQHGFVSLLAAPLRLGDQIIGGIRVYTGELHIFTDEEKTLLESLAGQAAVAIENARLYHELAQAHERLQKSYEDLRAAQAELVKRERLAVLGELSALVAHEIRNPLTAIRGFVQRTQRKVADQPALVQASQIVLDEVDRLDKVVADVLDFTRRLEPQLGEHSINLLVQSVLQLEGPTLNERGVQVVTNCMPSLPPVVMDPAQMRQVLLNLIANARHAMHGGGTLTFTTRAESGGVALDVTDTGPGIPPEVQAKLFTPFFTTKTHGTGLGLTVARRILEDHGGRLTYETTLGQGTTFTIHLPVKGKEDE
jgi:two-component system sensor histidine kinase HydH